MIGALLTKASRYRYTDCCELYALCLGVAHLCLHMYIYIYIVVTTKEFSENKVLNIVNVVP